MLKINFKITVPTHGAPLTKPVTFSRGTAGYRVRTADLGEGEYQGKLLIYLQVYDSREQTTHVETGTIVQYDSFRFVLSLFQTTYNILSYNTVNTGKVAV